MKVTLILCLALAGTTHALPILAAISQIANVLTIVTSIINFTAPAQPNLVSLATAIGFNGVNDNNELTNQPGTSSGTDGPFPMISITGKDRKSVVTYTDAPHINSGEKAVRRPNTDENLDHYQTNIYAGDAKLLGGDHTYFARNAICFKYITVTPDQSQSDTKPYLITAELLIRYFNVPWYYSGDFLRHYTTDGKCDIIRDPLPCVWLSAFNHEGVNFVGRITINNIPEYKMTINTRPLDEAALKSHLSIEWSHLPDKPSVYVEGGLPPGFPKRAIEEKDDSIIIDSDLPASTLCNDKSSYGPSFVSEREKMFCNMKTKKLYPQCGGKVTSSCYQIKNNTLSLEVDGPRRNSLATPAKISLPLRRFPKNKLAKRRDLEGPGCIEKEPVNWTPFITGSYMGDQVAQGSDFDRIGQRLAWMVERSAKEFEGNWVDYANGHDARFTCKKALVQDLAGCQRCIRFATDSVWSVLQSRTVGRLDLNCGSIQFSMKRGGDGGNGGGKCSRKLGRGDGKSGECCESSNDCLLICDKSASKCRPGNTMCIGLNPFKYGRGKGDGVPGDCCDTSSDCVKSCVNKQCSSTSSGGGGGGGKCSRKLGRADGRSNECCETSNDCLLVCDSSTKKCRPGSLACGYLNPYKYGRGKGDGVIGDCCDTSSDCVKSCVNRQCNSSGSGSSGKCSGGRPGLKDGSGVEGACCVTQADCKVCCSKAGVCNAACRD